MALTSKNSRNNKLKTHLAILQARAIHAKTSEDISVISKLIQEYSAKHQYSHNNSLLWLSLAIAGLVGGLSYWQQLHITQDTRFYMQVLSAITGCLTLILFYMRYAEIKRVGDAVYIRSVAINAGVVRDYQFDGRSYWKQLSGMFSLFNTGDESQTITTRYLGGMPGDEHQGPTPYTLFEFKYVRVTRSTNSKGGTRTSRSTHYKYGMLVQFSDFNFLSINVNRFPNKWDSSSRAFNKRFKVRCASEIQAAKFFDPKAVLAFVDEFSFIKSMDVTPSSVVCFELPKEIFPSKVKTPSLTNTTTFINSLETPHKLPALEQAQKLIAFINQNK
ncbi:hypothetical protein [Glaciecola petra]|uniref:DUF3137 domain-containing protein n=1 Tax=Glaciecola petra TaxID=3075602 RepID=A0ABU2ZL13_9ALTE|nr:hypothetical protein [Aestuariibacter sp. P117]MDT0593313.1 hypothetical protein [Aestuariibacter sp. P117]